MIEIFRPLRFHGLVTRLEYIRPLVHLAWDHVRILVGHIVPHLTLRLAPRLFARRGHPHHPPVLLGPTVLRQFRVCLDRLHRRMAATIQGQSDTHYQDAHGRYAAGETRHQKAVIRAVVGSSAIWGQKETWLRRGTRSLSREGTHTLRQGSLTGLLKSLTIVNAHLLRPSFFISFFLSPIDVAPDT